MGIQEEIDDLLNMIADKKEKGEDTGWLEGELLSLEMKLSGESDGDDDDD